MHASVRGTGCSSGEFDLFSWRSALDGKEIIDNWIPNQPWSNGDVGLLGHSYGGITGFMVAATQPQHLKAMTRLGTHRRSVPRARVPGWGEQLRLPAAVDGRGPTGVRRRRRPAPWPRPPAAPGGQRRTVRSSAASTRPGRAGPSRTTRSLQGSPRPTTTGTGRARSSRTSTRSRCRSTSSAPTRTSRPGPAARRTCSSGSAASQAADPHERRPQHGEHRPTTACPTSATTARRGSTTGCAASTAGSGT